MTNTGITAEANTGGFSILGGANGSASKKLATVDFASTPEPSGLILLGTGMVGAFGAARRKFLKA